MTRADNAKTNEASGSWKSAAYGLSTQFNSRIIFRETLTHLFLSNTRFGLQTNAGQ